MIAPRIIVLVGPPSSGKTTWAKNNQAGAVHGSQDDLIDTITPPGSILFIAPSITRGRTPWRAPRFGTATPLSWIAPIERAPIAAAGWEIANQDRYSAIAVVMSTLEELCRERNAKRDRARRRSEERMDRMFIALEPAQSEEPFAAIHIENGIGEHHVRGDSP